MLFAPFQLNKRSQSIITNLRHNIQSHPRFQHLTITLDTNELITKGCMSIEIAKNGRPLNLFIFWPNDEADIGSASIYGEGLEKHYAKISNSHNFFGLPVIQIDMERGFSDFIDVQIGRY